MEEKKERQKESKRKWRDANKQKIKEYRDTNKQKMKEYYIDNKEKLKDKQKEYYIDNNEKLKEQRKGYRDANKNKIKEAKKEYNQTQAGKKKNTISSWKNQHKILFKDKQESEFYYETYINTHRCTWCDVDFKNSSDRCFDHCHICSMPRAIICRSCNVKDEVPCVNCLL